MTDEELVKALRLLAFVHNDGAITQAADRIEQLQQALKDQSSVSDRLAEANEKLTAERDEAWRRAEHVEEQWGRCEAKLATCEKYRDAYDKMGRIGTEAYRDLEVKLAENEVRLGKAVEALRAFKAFDDMPARDKRPDVFEVSVRRKLLSTLAEIEGEKT
jgi:hypothetical protein